MSMPVTKTHVKSALLALGLVALANRVRSTRRLLNG